MCSLCRSQTFRDDLGEMKGFAQPINWGGDPVGDALSKYERQFEDLVRGVASGRIGPVEFEQAMQDILLAMHQDAHFAGQELADVIPPNKTLARFAGYRVAQAEIQYVRAFALAIAEKAAGLYDQELGEWKEQSLLLRTKSYMGRARGTATDGWVSASSPTELLIWVRTADESCSQCVYWSERGPFLASGDTNQFQYETLLIRPGENLTYCKFNCQCHLERVSDGAASPLPFVFAA